jgi:hypothetical protein
MSLKRLVADSEKACRGAFEREFWQMLTWHGRPEATKFTDTYSQRGK